VSAARVIVVGGGVIGLSCAHALARQGAHVVLLERERMAAGASGGNAGTLAPGHPPLNRPGRVREALARMLDPKSPLYIRPRWDPDLWRWLWDFARHCTHEHVEAYMNVMAPLGHEALADFDRLLEEEAIDCGYRREGYYEVCSTTAGLAAAREDAALIERYGHQPELVDGDELRRREPAFGPAVIGGVFYPEAATLDPGRFMAGLATAARAHGVELREGAAASEAELIEFCRENLAHFKAPKTVVIGELPKTSTGKIQKFVLRERARELK